MYGNEVVSNIELKGSFYSEMIIGYLNVRPLLRNVELSKSFCHRLILEKRLVETASVIIYEKAYK